MIKDIIFLFGLLFKGIFKLLFYIVKGIGWYISGIDQAIKSYPKKNKSKIIIKEEIL